MQIAPGTAGLDTDSILSPAAVQAAVRTGRLVFYRYVYRSGGMGPGEAGMIRQNGGTPASVYESSGLTIDQGYGMGQVEAQKLASGHFAAGGPKGVVVWLAAADRDGCNPGSAQAYVNGARDYLHANGLGCGIYGPFGLVINGLSGWDGWWQTMSTGFCGNAQTSRATLSQHFPYEYPGGIQCDGNTIHDPVHCGAWDGAVVPPPPADPGSALTVLSGGI